MYVVVHGDAARGEAIVQALGGEGQAALVERAGGAIRLAMDGVKLDALLVSPDVVDTIFFPGDFREEQALRGVPVLFDGGSRGPLYRAFKQSRASVRAFQHLRDATPEQAAAALRALPLQPEPPPLHRRVGWWLELALWLPLAAAAVASTLRPGLVSEQALPLLVGLFLMEMPWRHFVGPMLAAVRRGIRPTWGAMLGAVLFAYAVWLFAASAVRLWGAG